MATRNTHVPPEINAPTPGALLVVGRDPGAREEQEGRPFVGDAGQLLNNLLQQADIKRGDINLTNVVCRRPERNQWHLHTPSAVSQGRQDLYRLVDRLQPGLILTLGTQAAEAFMEDQWPLKRGGRRYGIRDIRGYVWDTSHGPVLTSLHPSGVARFRDPSGIGHALLFADIERAKEACHSLSRPVRDVSVVSNDSEAAQAVRELQTASELVAADIEISSHEDLLCVGFAARGDHAWVFPAHFLQQASALLDDPHMRLVWQNGQFDLHFLATRSSTPVGAGFDDCIVAWHTLWPEIAGKSIADLERNGGTKRTSKSLHFFASLYTYDHWFKHYHEASVRDMYTLNGRDCCITWDVARALLAEVDKGGLQPVYHRTLRRVRPVVACQSRGLLVDDAERLVRLETLDERARAAEDELAPLVREVAERYRDRITKPHLIWRQRTCSCCRGGAAKRDQCWSCEGFVRSPSKRGLLEWATKLAYSGDQRLAPGDLPLKATKEELVDMLLQPCRECDGRGKWEEFSFNPRSNEQKAMLLYDCLKLPKRAGVDEETLVDLLGWLEENYGEETC